MSNISLNYAQIIEPGSFKSINLAKIYIGEYGTLPNPANASTWKQAYFVNSDGTRTAASQPIRTNAAGYAVDGSGNIKTIQVDGGYSLLVQDQYGATKFSQARSAANSGAVLEFDIIADFTGALDGSVCYFKGRDTVGDGGGGLFWYSASSTQPTDGGTVFKPAAGGGRIFRQGWTVSGFNGELNIKWFGAKGDGVTDDTAAITAADAAALNGKTLLFPDGVYVCGRISLPDGNRYWFSIGATIKVKPGTYTGNINPLFSGSFGPHRIIFDGITFDQDWTNTTYPAGFSRNDAYKASSWGGGSWLGVFDGNQTATIEFHRCRVTNVFRGFLLKGQKRVAAIGCNVDANNSIGDSVFAAELCTNVEYSGNVMDARDWYTSGGVFTGANGLFGNTCRNVLIHGNQMRGFQLVFHATEPGASDVGMGRRCIVSDNIIEYPPADTAFYRWKELEVADNSIHMSGDMGIAVSGSSFCTVTGNVIKGTHIGGIGVTDCQSVVVANNSVLDVAQDYAYIQTLGGRYAGNAGAWISAITCDYQAGGQKGVECVISGNSLGWTTLPPVSDSKGAVRALVNGILIQTTANTASQSTFSITGNYVKSDAANMPSFMVNAPSHRFYIANGGKTGTPVLGETFTDSGGNSFVYLVDYGAGNLCFIKKLSGTIGTAVAFTGATSGAVIVSANPFPQLTWLGITGAGNYDRVTNYTNQNLGP